MRSAGRTHTHTRTHDRNVKFKTALPHPEYVQLSLPEAAFNETARDLLAKEDLCRKHTHTLTPAQAYGRTILLRRTITPGLMCIAIETGVLLPIGFLQQVGKQ